MVGINWLFFKPTWTQKKKKCSLLMDSARTINRFSPLFDIVFACWCQMEIHFVGSGRHIDITLPKNLYFIFRWINYIKFFYHAAQKWKRKKVCFFSECRMYEQWYFDNPFLCFLYYGVKLFSLTLQPHQHFHQENNVEISLLQWLRSFQSKRTLI